MRDVDTIAFEADEDGPDSELVVHTVYPKAGFMGVVCKLVISLLLTSIATISDMDGLCATEAWVHRRPSCIILNTSSLSYSSPMVLSTISKTSLVSYSFQTCNIHNPIHQSQVTLISFTFIYIYIYIYNLQIFYYKYILLLYYFKTLNK